MVLDVRRGIHRERQTCHIGLSAHFRQISLGIQFLHHSHHVDGTLAGGKVANGFVYLLVALVVEALRMQYFRNLEVSVLLHHQRTQHHSLHLEVLRLTMSEIVYARHLNNLLLRLTTTFCHACFTFFRAKVQKIIED